ncbi:hypothetical protein [Caulobacter hibisci]|uniref:Uncharacterized protein n=1 Tax=Caulobacter hibisci TaxID=2035993 RepID=A0ABS0SVA8_9CAUL|nr:hypothetical protein [Caulobacter hibisci]MBI1683546.1 hypothetical protein [Caulobacter hibisci]
MDIFGVIGDVLWILALSIMAGASRMAWRRIPKGEATPVAWAPKGETLLRLPRGPALVLLPAGAFAISLYLLVESRQAEGLTLQLTMLGLRATLAAILAVIHLSQVRRALNQLAAEGKIRL